MHRLSWWLNTKSLRARKFSPVSNLNPPRCTSDPCFLLFRPRKKGAEWGWRPCPDKVTPLTPLSHIFFFWIRSSPWHTVLGQLVSTDGSLEVQNHPSAYVWERPSTSETLLPILRGRFLLFPNNLFNALVCSPGWGQTCLELGVRTLRFSKASFGFFSPKTDIWWSIITKAFHTFYHLLLSRHFLMFPLEEPVPPTWSWV